MEAASLVQDTSLRGKIREYALRQRQDGRTHAVDTLRFGLGEIQKEIKDLVNLNTKDVCSIAARIKRRKYALTTDMYRLSHAFLQDNENIKAFAKVPGATEILIKELTSPQINRQYSAIECLCNLSLGEAPVCEKITTYAGSYLVTYLDSNEPILKRTALWTLANLLVTCIRAGKALMAMPILQKLWQIYTAPISPSHNYHEDAAICLSIIATHADELLTAQDRQYLANHVHEKHVKDPASEYYLYIIFYTETIYHEKVKCLEHTQHFLTFIQSCMEGRFKTKAEKFAVFNSVFVLTNMAAIFSKDQLEFDKPNQHLWLVSALSGLFEKQNRNLSKHLLRLIKNLVQYDMVPVHELKEKFSACAVRQIGSTKLL